MGQMGDWSRAIFAEASKTVHLDFTFEEQARLEIVADAVKSILEAAKRRQQTELGKAG